MKIVKREEFLKMRSGIIYSDFEPFVFNGLKIKLDSIDDGKGNFIDFFYQDLIGNVDMGDSCDFINKIDDSMKNGSSFPLDFDCIQRDGLFEKEAMYAVYSLTDLLGLTSRLMSLIEQK